MKDIAYCKNLVKKVNGELHTAEAVYGGALTLYLRMKCRSCEQRLDNFREFRARSLKAKVTSKGARR